jgi:SSS family solute:Na+ symporter
VAVSLATRARAEQDLKGLVYSLTPRLRATAGERWYARPAVLGACVLAGVIVLNFIFR